MTNASAQNFHSKNIIGTTGGGNCSAALSSINSINLTTEVPPFASCKKNIGCGFFPPSLQEAKSKPLNRS